MPKGSMGLGDANFDKIEASLRQGAPDYNSNIGAILRSRIIQLTEDLGKYIDFDGLKTYISKGNITYNESGVKIYTTKLDYLCAGGKIALYIDDFLYDSIEPIWSYLHNNDIMDQRARRIQLSERWDIEDKYETRKKYYQAFRIIITNWLEIHQGLLVLPLKDEQIPGHALSKVKPNYQKIEILKKST